MNEAGDVDFRGIDFAFPSGRSAGFPDREPTPERTAFVAIERLLSIIVWTRCLRPTTDAALAADLRRILKAERSIRGDYPV
ncbi:hypothetical protein [Mesorhizobium kowhaii]|uniref:hypothetical protein n=1 Tax=Mesorhizobium kowhaii TaxID=1300272 RepID=UPI0011B3CFD8|nr:hypothetical protein [Mesorhizobium kowhaii]